METKWIIAIALFIIATFLFWRLTRDYYKRVYGEKVWKQWAIRLVYWQVVVYAGALITILIMFLFKWGNVLTF